MPLLNRAKRLQESTKEVENLYLRHAAKDNSTTGLRNPGYRRVSLGGSANDQPARFDPKSIGVGPFSRDGSRFETRPRPRENGSFDAGGFAGRPRNQEDGGRFSTGRPPRFRENTTGLPERQRFPPRSVEATAEDDRRPERPFTARDGPLRPRFSRDSDSPSGIPRTQHGFSPRNDTRSEQPPRTAKDPRQFPARSINRERPQPGRPGRPRASRDEEGGEPRRRKRDTKSDTRIGPRGRRTENVWSEEEQDYFKQKEEKEWDRPTDYDPVEVNPETFSGVRPASVASQRGMSEILGERLMLAKRYIQREYIEWQSKEQKADVLILVERLKKEVRESEESKGVDEPSQKPQPEERGNENPIHPSDETEQKTQALMQKLFGGNYEFTGFREGKDVLGNVARQVERNKSYYPLDQRSLIEKVTSLMPSGDAARNQRTARAEVRK